MSHGQELLIESLVLFGGERGGKVLEDPGGVFLLGAVVEEKLD